MRSPHRRGTGKDSARSLCTPTGSSLARPPPPGPARILSNPPSRGVLFTSPSARPDRIYSRALHLPRLVGRDMSSISRRIWTTILLDVCMYIYTYVCRRLIDRRCSDRDAMRCQTPRWAGAVRYGTRRRERADGGRARASAWYCDYGGRD